MAKHRNEEGAIKCHLVSCMCMTMQIGTQDEVRSQLGFFMGVACICLYTPLGYIEESVIRECPLLRMSFTVIPSSLFLFCSWVRSLTK